MHPEDDPDLDKLLKTMQERMNENKETLATFKEKVDMLRGALMVQKVPEDWKFAIETILVLVEQIGKNRANIEETQYLTFQMYQGINQELSSLSDTVAGLGKHR